MSQTRTRSIPSYMVVAVLTDGDVMLDVRGITAEELGQLNELAQDVTEGELWWEVIECNCRRSSHTETLNAPGQRISPPAAAMLSEWRTQMGLAAFDLTSPIKIGNDS